YDLTNGILTISGLSYNVASYSYFLDVTGDKICPKEPIEAKVKILKIPIALFSEVQVSCIGGNDGQIKLDSVDPMGPNTYTLIQTGSINSTGNFVGLKAGIYTIRVQENGSPCFSDFDIEVTEPEQLELINLITSDPTCGSSNGVINFEIIGGIKDYTLILNNKPISSYINSITAGVYEIKDLSPGIYSLEVTDANGCQLNLPNLVTLVNDDGFAFTINPMVEEVCFGQDFAFSPVLSAGIPGTPELKWYKDAGLIQEISSSTNPDVDGIIYQINPSTGGLTISGQKAGDFTYYLEVSGTGICTLVEPAAVKVYPEITANILVSDIVCFGDTNGSISVTPSGGNGDFEISIDGSPFTKNFTYNNLLPGSYDIDLRNDIGCTFSETVIVKTPSSAISINSPTIERSSCDLSNGSVRDLVISGGWGGYVVEWRKGAVNGPIVPGDLTQALNLAPDRYFLSISDGQGCNKTFDFLIEESSDPVYAIVPPINSCSGSKIEIKPIHIAPNPSLPPAAATEVRWYTGPGQTGLIQDGPDPSNPSIQYLIDDSDWLNPELEITGLPAGNHDFYFYVVCTGKEQKIDVSVYDIPAVTLDLKAVSCFGDTNGKVKVSGGGLPSNLYSLNGGAPISQSALEMLNLASGNYSLAVTTPAGCAQSLSFIIASPASPLSSSPLSGIDPGCGASNGKLNLTISGGWLPYSIDVIKDGVSQGVQVINQTTISLGGYRPGVYQLIIKDSEGCTISTNSVALVDGPTQILINDEEICVGSVATLLPQLDPITAGASFQWFLDAGKTKPIISSPSPTSDGRIYQINPVNGELTIGNLPASAIEYNYYVSASGSGVCLGYTGVAKVKVYSSPTVTASVVDEACFGTGGSITVNASGGSGSYTYNINGGAFGSSNVFQVATGSYAIQVKTPEGCLVNLTNIQVTGPAAALVASNLEKDDPSCGLDNGEIRLTLTGGYAPYKVTYTKNGANSGSGNLAVAGEIRIPNLGIGVYEFKVTDSQGCTISVPTTFTLSEVPTVLKVNDDEICAGEVAISTPSVPLNIPNPKFSWTFDANGNNLIPNGTVNGVTYDVSSAGVLSISGLKGKTTPYIFYVNATGVG
ncbi:SprB repeat-containing protein, partial [Algoriphagus sp.]|uniref:SprB repeat-containing protein n=1 Tax=Algoriphagus sp. TaxID=1872435 RepID=UPI0025E7A417